MRLVPTGRLPDELSSMTPSKFRQEFPRRKSAVPPSKNQAESSQSYISLPSNFSELPCQTPFGVFDQLMSLVGQTPIGGRGSSSARPGPAMATADGDICVGQTVELRGKRRGACPKKSMSQQSLGKHSKSEWNGSAAASSTRP